MSYLLEILGRGLLAELAAAFRQLLDDETELTTNELREACQEHTGNPAIYNELGIRCLAERDMRAARESFRQVLELDPGDLQAHAGLACAYDELGDTERALVQLRDAVEYCQDDPTVHFAIGFCLEKLGRCDEAAESYHRSLDVAPNLRNTHERLAAVHVKQNDIEAAIEHYEHICFCEPGEIDSLLVLGNLYICDKRYDEAIRNYRTALTIDPDSWEAQDDLVTACDKAGLYYDAIEHLCEMIRTKPAFADNHLRLGDLYAKVGRESDALEQYLQAAHLNPDYLEAGIKVGTSYLRTGAYTDAAIWFNRATEINDRLLSAYIGLGVAQYESGQHEEAQESFEKAAGVEPNSTLLFSEMARLNLRSGAARQANRYLGSLSETHPATSPTGDLIARQIERYQAAIKERPNYADLHYQLGLLLRHCERNAEAIEAFRTALSINPHYEKASTKLGLVLHEEGRFDEAVANLRRSLTLDPESAELHYRLGLIFADRHKFDLAFQQFEHAAKHEPENLEFRANLALALQNMGLIDRADASWQVMCEVASQTEAGRIVINKATKQQQE